MSKTDLRGDWIVLGSTISHGAPVFDGARPRLRVQEAGGRYWLSAPLRKPIDGDNAPRLELIVQKGADGHERAIARSEGLWILLDAHDDHLRIVARHVQGNGGIEDDSGGEWNGGRP